MKCTQSRSLLSDLVERRLAPPVHAELADHLSRCGACRAELQDLKRTILVLRSSRGEEPPPALAAAVRAAIAAAPAPSPAAAVRVAGGARAAKAAARARGPRRTAVWPAAAALLLVTVLASFIAWRERTWSSGRLALEKELELSRDEMAQASARLEAELRAAKTREMDLRRGLSEAAAAEGDRRRALEEQVARLEASAATDANRVEALGTDLAAARAEAGAARREAQACLERSRAAGEADKASRPRAAPPGLTSNRPLAPRPGVAFREADGRLELRLQGARKDVVPELLRVASEESNPAMVELALGALESFLGRTLEAPSDPEAVGEPGRSFRDWWSRKFDGAGSLSAEPAAPAESPRLLRLEALKDAWERDPAAAEKRSR